MGLEDLLEKKKNSIKKRWLDLIIDTYPVDSHNFFKNQKNRFANPVGHSMIQAIDGIFQDLFSDDITADTLKALEEFVKIRAVQEFTSAKAVQFILLLKVAIREELESAITEKSHFEELMSLESKIDTIMLLTFDAYTRARETLFQIRIREIKSQTQSIINTKHPK